MSDTKVVVAKTSSYQIESGDNNAVFTNRGASTGVTFTLPVTTSVSAGFSCEFFTVAAQIITIASSPTDNLINHGDAGGDTIATAAVIGQHLAVISDGIGWLVISDPSAATTATAVSAVTLVS